MSGSDLQSTNVISLLLAAAAKHFTLAGATEEATTHALAAAAAAFNVTPSDVAVAQLLNENISGDLTQLLTNAIQNKPPAAS